MHFRKLVSPFLRNINFYSENKKTIISEQWNVDIRLKVDKKINTTKIVLQFSNLTFLVSTVVKIPL